jgi:hypothetical protein
MNQTTSAGVHCGGFQPTALLLWQSTKRPTTFGISIIKIASIIPSSDIHVNQAADFYQGNKLVLLRKGPRRLLGLAHRTLRERGCRDTFLLDLIGWASTQPPNFRNVGAFDPIHLKQASIVTKINRIGWVEHTQQILCVFLNNWPKKEILTKLVYILQ